MKTGLEKCAWMQAKEGHFLPNPTPPPPIVDTYKFMNARILTLHETKIHT